MVGAGVRHGRDAEVTDLRAIADLGLTSVASTVVATRGELLILTRTRFSSTDVGAETFLTDILGVIEVDVDDRITATVVFDPDDFEAAFAELDARYLAGEAAAHVQTWSTIASSYAALNRRELPSMTPDCANIDHRRETAFGPGDLTAYIRVGWDVDQDINVFVAEVHRLNNVGAVITYAAHETSAGALTPSGAGSRFSPPRAT